MPENLSYIKLRGSFASVGVCVRALHRQPALFGWNESGLSLEHARRSIRPIHLQARAHQVVRGRPHHAFPQALQPRFHLLQFAYVRTRPSTRRSPGGTGFSKIIIQSGNVRNQRYRAGIGLSRTPGATSRGIPTTPCRPIKNKIISLANNCHQLRLRASSFSHRPARHGRSGRRTVSCCMEGGTLGDLYSRRDLRYDENNAIYIDENGNVATETIQDVKKYRQAGQRAARRQHVVAQRLPLEEPELRLHGFGPSGRHRLLAYAGHARPIRRVRGYGRGARCRRRDAQRRRRGGCLHLVFGHRRRQFHPAVLHLLGHERAVAGGFDRLHDSPQAAA